MSINFDSIKVHLNMTNSYEFYTATEIPFDGKLAVYHIYINLINSKGHYIATLSYTFKRGDSIENIIAGLNNLITNLKKVRSD